MNILLVVVFVLPSLLYAFAWRQARAQVLMPRGAAPIATQQAGRSAASGAAISGHTGGSAGATLVVVGLLLHAFTIALAMSGTTAPFPRVPNEAVAGVSSLHFGFAGALSVTLWLGIVILWLEGRTMHVEALQLIVLPIAAVAVLLPLFFPGADLSRLAGLPLFVPHLLVGTLAYGLLLLAALHAGLMMAAERALHSPTGGAVTAFASWLDRLPPLLVLERILFRFIWIGFVMLTLTALSGILFSDEIFGKPLRFDHKTVFTLIAWALFGLLLIGRSRWGWRGRTALRLTLSGFVVLMLAYVGSHFVLEVLLQRY